MNDREPSLYDEDTGLPGPALVCDRLQVAIACAMRNEDGLAVFVVEVERLHLIDEAFGSEVKAQRMQAVAHALRAMTRPDETVARLAAGTFALVLTGFANSQQIVTRAQTILLELGRSSSANGQRIHVTAGIGVAVFPRDAIVPEELLSVAVLAATRAREAGGNTVRYHAPDMEARSFLRLDVESRLRRAMTRNELRLDYQPKYSLASSMVCGAEALLRWRDHERGAIPPNEFIPVAEETDLILGLGSWVIRRACAMLRERTRLGFPEVPVSVNVSVRQFFEQDVPELVRTALDDTGVEPRFLQLEVTEGLFVQDSGRALHMLSTLRDMGVLLALDDFGKGYFSLSELKHLPVNYLKIDPSFIRGMRGDDRDQAIVDSIVRMGHRLGFRVVAEGVETAWEADHLREMGCDEAQGYYYCRPMPEDEFARLIAAPISRRSQTNEANGQSNDRTLMRSA